MEAPEPPTCILCPDDFSCLGALSALEELNLRVPQDVSLAGCDGIRMGQMMHPRLTTVRQDAAAIARQAIVQLLDAIENPDTHRPCQTVMPAALLPGETLGPVHNRVE